MPSTPRSRLRIALAVVGVLLLFMVLYLGVGCLVFWKPEWVARGLGRDLTQRIALAYENAASGLFPGDRDGDGYTDVQERLDGTNVDDAQDPPHLFVDRETDRIAIGVFGDPTTEQMGYPVTRDMYQLWVWIEPGERCHVRGRLSYALGEGYGPFVAVPVSARVPRGFQVRIEPPPGIRLGVAGGELAPAELTVPVAPDGSLVFDLQFAVEESHGMPLPSSLDLKVRNAATGKNLDGKWVSISWKMDPLVPTVTRRSAEEIPGADARSSWWPPQGRSSYYEVTWPAPPAGASGVMIETARDEPGAEWIPIVDHFGAKAGRCLLQRKTGGVWKPYDGPLKFRIVPYRRDE